VSKLGELCPIISEFTLFKRAIFAAISAQFDDDDHSSRWRFQTDCNMAILILAKYVIGSHFSTPRRNLVRFGSVTPEFI